MTNHRASLRGFSIVEFVLVIAITGIISVGLASVIEVPRVFLEQRQNSGPDLSSTQSALAMLQDDVQFATAAHVVAAGQLVLDRSDGSTVTWDWDGVPTHPLTRTAGGQTVALVPSVASVTFTPHSSTYNHASGDDKLLVQTPVQTAQFDTFSLKPGFVLGKVIFGMTKVNLLTALKNISDSDRTGIFFVPTNIDDDRATLASITVKLQRLGARDLDVQVFEANASKLPVRANPVAHAVVPNRALPVTAGDVTIPMSSQRKLDKTKTYFVEFKAVGSGLAAGVQATYLSNGAAAQSTGSSLLVSTDSGSTFAPITAASDGSQTQFSMTAVKAAALDDADLPPSSVITVQTQVAMSLKLANVSGVDTLTVMYPMLNAIAQVTQVK